MNFQQAAEEASRVGARILEEWGEKFTAQEKSPANLVTEADLASQGAIVGFLKQHFPDHCFLGEEGLTDDSGDARYRWVIDPLDGTSNYVHRYPFYAVSIGLECDGEMIVGVIYDPNRDEMFSAAKGAGATLNGKPIQVSAIEPLKDAMCMASLPVKVHRGHPALQYFIEALELAQTVQRSGSAALNLCYVAMGRIEAFWSLSLKAWDVAAGVLMVTEAGGRVTETRGGNFSIERPDLLATNGRALHDELVTCFRNID